MAQKPDDRIICPDQWTFNSPTVAAGFDKHVREQLPWYDLATVLVAHFARHYLPKEGVMYDIGASTGNITKALHEIITTRGVSAHSIEVSPDMCMAWVGVGELHQIDCRVFEYEPYDFSVLFLVLMFIPEKDREPLLQRLKSLLQPGGALLVFDKIVHQGGYLGNVIARMTLAGKVSTGVSAEDIVAKELSLGGVQRPVDISHSQVLQESTMVFQFGEFVGWLITAQ